MRAYWIAGLVLLLNGCSNDGNTVHTHRILAFGTIIDVTIVHPDEALARQAFSRLTEDFNTMHEVWHPWRPGSLGRVNSLLKTGQWFSAAPSVVPLIRRARELSIMSGGYFNPAMGKLIGLWGFHRDNYDEPFEPDMEAIAKHVRDIPDMHDVEIDGLKMRGLHPALQVDSGGIGKGLAIEQAMETLQSMGVTNAMINAGGDLKVIGKQVGRPWTVGIQHPRKDEIIASIGTLENESVFTSGDYQRYYFQGEKRRSHIIDPFTGMTVDRTVAVTVIHADAGVADATATALMVAGAQKWQHVAHRMQVDQVLLLDVDGKLHVSPKMLQRLEFSANPPWPLVIGDR